MYKINSSSQKILEKMLGKKYREIVDMDYDDEISICSLRVGLPVLGRFGSKDGS